MKKILRELLLELGQFQFVPQHVLETPREVEQQPAATDLSSGEPGLFAELNLVGLVAVLALIELDDPRQLRGDCEIVPLFPQRMDVVHEEQVFEFPSVCLGLGPGLCEG